MSSEPGTAASPQREGNSIISEYVRGFEHRPLTEHAGEMSVSLYVNKYLPTPRVVIFRRSFSRGFPMGVGVRYHRECVLFASVFRRKA